MRGDKNLQSKEAEALRKAWGDKPCKHPNLEKEYYLGADTGDWVCTICGRSGWGKDWPEKERQEERYK